MNILKESLTQYRGLSRSVYVIFFARMVTSMGAFIWPMLTLILSNKLGYEPDEIAIISVGVILLYLPAQIIGGKLADKYNRKRLIIVLDLLSVALFISCGFVEPGLLMMVFFVFAGLFANMEQPAFEALIADSTKPAEREKVYSLSYLGMNLGLIIGASVGGMLFENYLNYAFIFDGLTTLSSTIMIVAFVKIIKVTDLEDSEKNEYEDHVHDDTSVWALLKERKSLMIIFGTALLGAFVYQQWGFALPLYLEDLYPGSGARYYGYLTSYNGALVVFFTPILTRLLSKYTEVPKMILGSSCIAISYLIIVGQPVYFIFFVMIFAFTIGEILNSIGNAPYFSRRVPTSHRGRLSSYLGICYMVGGIIGQLVTGFMLKHSTYNKAFILLAVVGAIGAVVHGINYGVDRHIFPKLYDKKVDVAISED